VQVIGAMTGAISILPFGPKIAVCCAASLRIAARCSAGRRAPPLKSRQREISDADDQAGARLQGAE
jgi:hypothetical protein